MSLLVSRHLAVLDGWRWPQKALLVLGAYLLAVLAGGVMGLALLWWHDGCPDVAASSGMSAFGDALFALGVTGLLCLPPTALACWFLRRMPWYGWVAGVLTLALGLVLVLGVSAS